ncbi:hypothetical protein [Candidatus Odyssella thessalonicensis]|uniref:hypothetical protein n=1 Tax=Candidatus Odyssella thessalonicensis TaxID=84647 RepID=UPI000225ACF6|nr:hypothetical protein [Candidatus Odyssella thessalonicensis]
MNCINRQTTLKTLQEYVASWPESKLLFSYKLAYQINLSHSTLLLEQKQTQFSLRLGVNFISGYLQINTFDLKTDEPLENRCPPLYDAALVELVVQALEVIYQCAELINSPKVSLLLTREQAEHLNLFGDFFSSVSSQMTVLGKRTLLELPTWDSYYQYFKTETEAILAHLRQTIWREQRVEPLIRQYLKSWPSSNRLDLGSPLMASLAPEKLGKLIKFPPPKQAI